MPTNKTATRSPDRLFAFSDALYAIAITLLALEIKLPADTDLNSNSAVWQAIIHSAPHLLAFVISFLVIGVLWVNNHRKYSNIDMVDSRFVWLNMASLLLIAFMPFPTSLISSSSTVVATALYASVVAIIGILSAVTWHYAVNKQLVPRPSRSSYYRDLWAPISLSLVFACSITMAPLGADAMKYFWILLIPVLWLTRKKLQDSR